VRATPALALGPSPSTSAPPISPRPSLPIPFLDSLSLSPSREGASAVRVAAPSRSRCRCSPRIGPGCPRPLLRDVARNGPKPHRDDVPSSQPVHVRPSRVGRTRRRRLQDQRHTTTCTVGRVALRLQFAMRSRARTRVFYPTGRVFPRILLAPPRPGQHRAASTGRRLLASKLTAPPPPRSPYLSPSRRVSQLAFRKRPYLLRTPRVNLRQPTTLHRISPPPKQPTHRHSTGPTVYLRRSAFQFTNYDYELRFTIQLYRQAIEQVIHPVARPSLNIASR
jgi:hypothetical protein